MHYDIIYRGAVARLSPRSRATRHGDACKCCYETPVELSPETSAAGIASDTEIKALALGESKLWPVTLLGVFAGILPENIRHVFKISCMGCASEMGMRRRGVTRYCQSARTTLQAPSLPRHTAPSSTTFM